MTRFATALLSATLIAGFAVGATAQPRPMMRAPSMSANFDPAQLPETKGKVAQYTLTPWGEVDGLILADGTEIQLPPRMSAALVYSVRPGDAVTIHGLRARAVPMVVAASITNDATGVVIAGQPEHTGMEVTGVVKAALHTPRGDAGGVLLADGTVVRLPPPEAAKLAAILAPGQTVVVRGDGITSPLGRVVAARQIGPSADKLTEIGHPRGMMEGMRGMMGMHGHGPRGDGPKGDGPKPQ
jgi:hypothetical protein